MNNNRGKMLDICEGILDSSCYCVSLEAAWLVGESVQNAYPLNSFLGVLSHYSSYNIRIGQVFDRAGFALGKGGVAPSSMERLCSY
ncbi:MAG: hypothetical protein ACI3Y4_08130 [Candidatus Cryptobacteroides sp.]